MRLTRGVAYCRVLNLGLKRVLQLAAARLQGAVAFCDCLYCITVSVEEVEE